AWEMPAMLAGAGAGKRGKGTAVFTTQTQALNHAQAEEDEGRRDADRLEGRDQTDGTSADAHASQGEKEGVLAANPVAHPSEQERAQRADQKTRGEQCDRA